MTPDAWPSAGLGAVLAASSGLALTARAARRRHLDRWLVPYLVRSLRRRARAAARST